jgi:hypothetical protein
MHADRVTLAYDKDQFPQLCIHIKSAAAEGNTTKLLNALAVCRRALSPATKVAEAAGSDLFDELLALAAYKASDKARERAALCLEIILSHAAGRACVTSGELSADTRDARLSALTALVEDSSQRVRLHSLRGLDALSRAPPGPEVLANGDMVGVLSASIAREGAGRSGAAAEAEAAALACLARCAQSSDREGVVQCIAAEVPAVAVEALARGRGTATAEAARLLTALATPAHGKLDVLSAGATLSACEAVASTAVSSVAGGSVPQDELSADKLAACLALLGTLCIDKGAKRDTHERGMGATLVAILTGWKHPSVLLQACRAIEVLAELPVARDALIRAGAERALLDVRDAPRAREAVVRASNDAHKSVTWKP